MVREVLRSTRVPPSTYTGTKNENNIAFRLRWKSFTVRTVRPINEMDYSAVLNSHICGTIRLLYPKDGFNGEKIDRKFANKTLN